MRPCKGLSTKSERSPSGAELPRNSPCSLPQQPALVLGQRRHLGVAHAGADLLQHALEHRVLHLGAAADERHLLGALDGLEAINELGRIDERGPARKRLLDMGDEPVRDCAGADPADAAIGAPLEFLCHDLGLIGIRVGDRGEGIGVNDFSHATIDCVRAVEVAVCPARAHLDDRHRVGGVEDDAPGISVDRRRSVNHLTVPPSQSLLFCMRSASMPRSRISSRTAAQRRSSSRVGDRLEKPFVHHIALW